MVCWCRVCLPCASSSGKFCKIEDKMGEREFSCIRQVIKTVQIPLPATFISNEISGIAEILESWKRQYKKQLQGVVVNYRQYSLSSASGFIAPNKPFVYYNVKATFDLFCPKVGDIVKGRINRISNEHIGCLIEETINVTIHLSKDPNRELSPFIHLNREILFEISYFNYDRKMIRVTGKITPKCIQLMKNLFPPVTFNSLIDTPELSNNTDEGIGTSNESTDDGLLNHSFDDSAINNNGNFKKPLSSNTKSKKKSSKRPKSDSEASSIDTSDILISDKKPKNKKKHKDKTNPDMGNHVSSNNLSSDSVSCNALIQNFSNFKHEEILGALKEEVLPFEDTSFVKKHKKKRKDDSISSFVGESTQSNNQNFHEDASNLVLDTSAVIETAKLSKKRKRESESLFTDAAEHSNTDETPKKKKKHKDKTVPPLEKEIKNELLDMPVDDIVNAGILSIKKEVSSPVKVVNTVPESKKKKNKDKKSKDKDKNKSKDKHKSKKKEGKVLVSGAVLKNDKKSHKKSSKKNKLDGERSKNDKKGKKDKKDKSEKKKKKNITNKKISDVMKCEID